MECDYSNVLYDRSKIIEFLPHGEEFCYLDAITQIDIPTKTIKGYYNVKDVRGHFKKVLVFPLVLKIEAIAQLGAFFLRSQDKYKDYIPIFSGEYLGTEYRSVTPGERLDLEVVVSNVKYNKDGMIRTGKGIGKAYVKGELVHEVIFGFRVASERVLERKSKV